MATRRREAPARRSKTRSVSVDFTGVDTGGGGRLLPEATYKFELVELEEEQGQDSGEPYLAGVFKVVEGEYEGTKAYDNFSLQPQALWKLRSFLESAGYQTEEGPMEIPYDDMVGLIGEADVIHEEYKKKTKHRINSWIIEGSGSDSDDQQSEREERSSTVKKRANGSGRREEPEVEWKVKDEVSFKDGKKTLTGRITELDGDSVTVKVGREEFEMTLEDISAP